VNPVKPTVNTLTADNLRQRVEKFNRNDHGLVMSVVSICYISDEFDDFDVVVYLRLV